MNSPLEAADNFRRHIEPLQDLIEWAERRPVQTQFGYRSENDKAAAIEKEAYQALSKALALYSTPMFYVTEEANE